MQITTLAALAAVAQSSLSSAAYIRRQDGMGTSSYAMPNQTSFASGRTAPATGVITIATPSGSGSVPSGRVSSKASSKMVSKSSSDSGDGLLAPPVATQGSATQGTGSSNSSSSAPSTSSSKSNSSSTSHSGMGGLGLDAPVYNLNNVNCNDFSSLNASAQWAAVDGDEVVSKFQDMFNKNLLVCNDCFGMSKGDCNSKNLTCTQGLSDLAVLPGSKASRWDTAAARFAQDPDITDLQCRIQTGECSAAPVCSSCNGPGSFAILKSLEVMNNALMNQYNAIIEAGHECTNQMTAFSSTFAPIPSIADKAMTEGLITTILGGILGFAGIFGGIAALGVGIFAEINMNNLFFGQPGPADTSSILGTIANSTAQQYVQISDSLFSTGSYTYQSADGTKGKTITLQDLMKNGALMQSDGSANTSYTALVPVYSKIMYQQLAYYTWQNMEKDGQKHTPFIVFTSGACSAVSDKTNGFGKDGILSAALSAKNTTVDYKGNCYWLLDGSQVEHESINYSGRGGNYVTYSCGIKGALPGGDSDTLNKNSDIFADLSLEDFIIPSVEGWLKNGKNDDYQQASSNGQLVTDPRSAGALNIPVCDYVGNANMPGVNCPKLGSASNKDKGCDLVPRNAIGNAPGTFVAGNCGVHVKQYQKNEGNENNFNNYQLEVTIFDGAQRAVGDAAKQLAAAPLAISGSLPYQLIVGAGGGDDDPIEFWYADDYWNSNDQSHHCSVGKYDSGMRQMDCGFSCPQEPPSFGDSNSATIGHKLFAAPTPAIVADATYVNTWATPSPTAAPSPTATPPPPANIAGGQCGVHVRQYQKNEGDENPTGDYWLEVSLNDNASKNVGQSGKVDAAGGKVISVNGLIAPFTVSTENVDSDGLDFTLKGLKWNSASKSMPNGVSCSVGKYDSGHRDMDCGFPCAP